MERWVSGNDIHIYGHVAKPGVHIENLKLLTKPESTETSCMHDNETDSAAECNLKLMKDYIYVAGLCYLFIL